MELDVWPKTMRVKTTIDQYGYSYEYDAFTITISEANSGGPEFAS